MSDAKGSGEGSKRGPEKGRRIAARPFFSYYGGKWRDAVRNYPSPAHRTIVEPFAGSAGYSVRYACHDVVLCEIDPIIAEVWRYLIRVTPAEIMAIPDIAHGETVDSLQVCQEARWLVGLWLNRGASRPRKSPSKWMREGLRPGSFWGERVRSTIASQVGLIRHWRVYECSYVDMPDTGRATWFVDPPYVTAGKHYRFGSVQVDYPALGDWCRARIGQVIVCENEGADWLPFQPLAVTKTTRTGARSREASWVSAQQDPDVSEAEAKSVMEALRG